jgi:cytidyltransferase-like protein
MTKQYDYAICSGYFDPLHEGHLDLFDECKKIANRLWVIVNNDKQLALKRSIRVFDEMIRIRIVASIKNISYVTLSYDNTSDISITLGIILNQIKFPLMASVPLTAKVCFVNSGDRNKDNSSQLENDICSKRGCDIKYINMVKANSSSGIIKSIISQATRPK